jgi:DNA-binding MarR family transcriptional regulator
MDPGSPARTPAGAALTRLVLESFRLNARVLAAGDRITRDFGTTTARWSLLSQLELAGEPRTVAQVARALGLRRQGIQRLADALQAEGLLEFRRNPGHARAMLVTPTASGHRLLERLNARQAQWANRLGGGLEARALDRATAGLLALRGALEADEPSQRRRRGAARAA